MKKTITKLGLLLLFTFHLSLINAFGQVPQSINYQAVLRNASGQILQNQNAIMKFTIHQATANGISVYEETQTTATDEYGLVNLQIGEGTPTIGPFSAIQWGTNSYFLQVQGNIGAGYVDLGTTQFVTVPFAMVADTVLHGGSDNWGSQTANTNATLSGNGTSGNPLGISKQGATNGQVLKWNGTSWVPANDSDAQELSLAGTSLSISNGNTVILPSNTGWGLNGNAGTNPVTDFLGTVDLQALEFRTDNVLRTRITTKGQIEIFNTGNSIFIGKGAGAGDDLTENKNVFIGDSVGNKNTSGYSNTGIGNLALYSNTTGYQNTAIGDDVLYSNIDGHNNTAIGYRSLQDNTTGDNNVAIGYIALSSNIDGNYNSAFGFGSMHSNTSGKYNTASGYNSIYSNIDGNYNTACGDHALQGNTSGDENVAIGYKALFSNTSDNNTAVGTNALRDNTSGYSNTALGTYALVHNIDGDDNTAIGNGALGFNTSGENNVAIGTSSLDQNITGTNNTACGYGALSENTSGHYNTALGKNAFDSGSAYSNSTALGYNAYDISSDNMVRIGSSSVTSIGGKVSWTSLSDARVKINVQENVPGLPFILGLKPVTYFYDKNKESEITGVKETGEWEGKDVINKMQFSGFLAQDVEKAAQKVGYNFSGIDKPENENGLWGLRYAEFVVPLVKGMQEQQAMIEDLQQRLARLQEQLDELQNNK